MGTTPIYALPYPELTDVANVPADTRELAERVEAMLASLHSESDYPSTTSPVWLTPNTTNITLTGSYGHRVGRYMSIYLVFTMKVASNWATSGDIGNIAVGTLTPGFEAWAQAPLSSTGSGRVMGGTATNTTVTIAAIGGTVALSVGEVCSLAGTYLLANP